MLVINHRPLCGRCQPPSGIRWCIIKCSLLNRVVRSVGHGGHYGTDDWQLTTARYIKSCESQVHSKYEGNLVGLRAPQNRPTESQH